jgi:invasion protein IalB
MTPHALATLLSRRPRRGALASALAAVLLLAGALPAGPAAAQDTEQVRRLGEFQDWRAFTYTEDGSKVCYMASEPKSEEGDYTRRGEVYAMVTHRPAQGSENVVSFIIGYPFQEDSRVSVNIDDSQSFTLFTHKDTAWAPDSETDRQLVQAMRAGRQMVVEGTSARGTDTTDTYSLLGFTAAHNRIGEACNVN